ncbi:MAG TPA: T9SS type A sorting domain-containing protein [Cytophagaceae bacterium]|nr:T9SS type A sorting domain-containing protein [Cytophagaceae bacterium]
MKKLYYIAVCFTLFTCTSWAQLPAGGQWGCPSIPVSGEFDTTCFKPSGQILLGQGYFDHYGSSDPVYLVVPDNRPSFALSMAVAWSYYRNVLGNNGMSINEWFATMGQENGFASYNGVVLPGAVYDQSSGSNVALPCIYPRGCNSNTCAGAGYCWHVSQNGTDGPYHNTLTGYQTISPYVPQRYPGPASTYHTIFNSNMEMASMNKTYYDLSIYRRAQYMNGIDIASVEASSPDPYGVEAAQAYAYNQGPNASSAISAPSYTLPAGIGSNNNWATNYYSGGVSCYAQRVAAMTAVLDNNEAYAQSHYPSGCGGNVNNWNFYSFYDSQISWDTVLASINRLLIMYPEINGSSTAKANFISAVQTAFNRVDSDGNGSISFRYEMGSVIDAIVLNLPKDDPAFNGQFAINGTGCKLDCQAPYTVIRTSGPKTICVGQSVILTADVESATTSTTYQWQKNGSNITGATSKTYTVTPSVPGTDNYSVIVCWSTVKLSSGAATTCCAQPECSVTIVTQASCSSCSMGLSLTPTANSCTGMANGSIKADVSIASGPYTYILTGPAPTNTVTTVNSSATSNIFTGLRDGKYTVEVRQQSTPSCRAVQDVTIVPTTIIKESLTATQIAASCNTQLNAVLTNQKPNSCTVKVDYGAMGIYNWDVSFFMDLRVNGASSMTLYEGFPGAGSKAWPWNYPACTWPSGCPAAPATATISVNDGDTLSVYGSTIVPQGTPVPGYYDGGVVLSGTPSAVTFTDVSSSANSSSVNFKYQGPAPTNSSRQVGNTYVVACPVVSPPAYTYSWSPTTGLTNPNISNPVAAINTATTYTVTATHPSNASCKLTATINVAANCTSLPVDLIDFTVKAVNSTAQLNWITTNESNCATYTIERSEDGIHFETIATIPCHNISSINEYIYTDARPPHGISYYRIKEGDYNNQFLYSEILDVNFDPLQVSVQPNPFGNETKITIEGTGQKIVTLSVTDVTGKILMQQTLSSEKILTLGSEYSSGVYVLQIMFDDVVKTYKLIKQ